MPPDIEAKGRIVEAYYDRKKALGGGRTYGYILLKILTPSGFYSVIFPSSKVDKLGFLPRRGQWIRVKGKVSDNEYFGDRTIKRVVEMEHIEEPKTAADRIMERIKETDI